MFVHKVVKSKTWY